MFLYVLRSSLLVVYNQERKRAKLKSPPFTGSLLPAAGPSIYSKLPLKGLQIHVTGFNGNRVYIPVHESEKDQKPDGEEYSVMFLFVLLINAIVFLSLFALLFSLLDVILRGLFCCYC